MPKTVILHFFVCYNVEERRQFQSLKKQCIIHQGVVYVFVFMYCKRRGRVRAPREPTLVNLPLECRRGGRRNCNVSRQASDEAVPMPFIDDSSVCHLKGTPAPSSTCWWCNQKCSAARSRASSGDTRGISRDIWHDQQQTCIVSYFWQSTSNSIPLYFCLPGYL